MPMTLYECTNKRIINVRPLANLSAGQTARVVIIMYVEVNLTEGILTWPVNLS